MTIAKYDSVIALFCAIVIPPITALFWYWGILWAFHLPKNHYMKALWHGFKATPDEPKIYGMALAGLLLGFAIFVILYNLFKTNFQGAYFSTRLRGPAMASQWMLRIMSRERGNQLRIGSIGVPTDAKFTHFQFTGSTGGGKSQAIGSMMDSAQDESRMACIDPNGTFMSNFYREGDYILNPFDLRTQNWTIFNEIRNAADCEHFAVCVIPKSASAEHEQWNRMARVIVSETMLRLKTQGKGTTKELTHWLTSAPNEELATFLADSPAAGMFHGASETLGSVRTVLTAYVKPHSFMPDAEIGVESFSIRKWVEEGKGNLWVPWRQDMLEALRPLISCWTDVIAAATLSVSESSNMLYVVDELDSLEKLNYFSDLATKGRKHGVTLVAGLQSLAQLDSRYGKTDALTLRNSLRTMVTFGISEGDTYTAEQLSLGFGDHEVVRTVRQSEGGRNQDGQTRERIIMPSEIHGLPNLTGYLKFPGAMPTAKFSLDYIKREAVIEPFIRGDTKWTVDIADYNIFNKG